MAKRSTGSEDRPTVAATDGKKQVLARIDPALHLAISTIAAIEGLTISDYVERALHDDLGSRRNAVSRMKMLVSVVEKIEGDVAASAQTDDAGSGAR